MVTPSPLPHGEREYRDFLPPPHGEREYRESPPPFLMARGSIVTPYVSGTSLRNASKLISPEYF